MSTVPDATHHPSLRSWVETASSPDHDFPIQNLPFGRFRRGASTEDWRIGVAIGDQILDLKHAATHGTWSTAVQELLPPLARGDLNSLMGADGVARRALRAEISRALAEIGGQRATLESSLVPQIEAEMSVPCRIGDYTDFYTGIHHASAVGKLLRPDNPLLPNYKWVPIGYHGRGSSILVSGHPIKRPLGQIKGVAATPVIAQSRRLDYELELGILIGKGNRLGTSIPIESAEAHLFGVVLLNDWSARDFQTWEYQPLGPFLSKNFATTLSPWVVTMEALAPFRVPFQRPAGDPPPLPYLNSSTNAASGAIDITLEAWLQTSVMRKTGRHAIRMSQTNFQRSAYWTAAQLIAHHTLNGCNLQTGDLFGSGTQSGPERDEAGSLLELSAGGTQVVTLPNGEQRTFLEDGDTVTLKGYCARAGAVRIGLGEVTGTVFAG